MDITNVINPLVHILLESRSDNIDIKTPYPSVATPKRHIEAPLPTKRVDCCDSQLQIIKEQINWEKKESLLSKKLKGCLAKDIQLEKAIEIRRKFRVK